MSGGGREGGRGWWCFYFLFFIFRVVCVGESFRGIQDAGASRGSSSQSAGG